MGYVHQGAILAPFRAKKLKIALYQFLLIGLLEEKLSANFWHLFKFYRCYGNKYGR